ncbi:MAG: restriction endonuclease subunit S [Chloroflexota bacterium]|nr:MAG: restriction endonuclease subunit S [Chloroflexota bacterium]
MGVKPGCKQTEVGVIPEDWDVLPLGRLIKRPPSYGINAAAIPLDARFPTYIRITDVTDDGRFARESRVSVSHSASSSYVLDPGDIVLARTGASVGKSYMYRPRDGYLVFAGFLIRVSPNNDYLLSAFLAYFTQSQPYWNWITANSMRSGQPGINGQEYAALIVPLPPTIAEQEAIAEALGDADALIESLEELIAKKCLIKQGAMQELLTGKRRLPGFSGEWEVKRLGSVLRFQVGSPFMSSFFNDKNQGLRLVRNRDLKSDDQTFYYSGAFNHEFLVYDGDVLVGMDGDFLPRIWAKGAALLNQRVGRIVCRDGLDRVFASYYLIDPLQEIEDTTLSTTVKHLAHGDVEKIENPLPEIEEQLAIAAVLSDMDSEIEALQAKLAKARQIKQGMMQELLTGRIRLV